MLWYRSRFVMLLAPEMIDTDLHTGWTELRERLQGFVALRVSPANAEDVLQDALLRIQRGLPDLRESDRLGPWIYRVTRSAIADHLRARTRSIERTETCAPEELDGAALSVDEPDTRRPRWSGVSPPSLPSCRRRTGRR